MNNKNAATAIKIIYTVCWSVLLFVASFFCMVFSESEEKYFSFQGMDDWNSSAQIYIYTVLLVWIIFIVDEVYNILKQYGKNQVVVHHAIAALIGQVLFMVFFAGIIILISLFILFGIEFHQNMKSYKKYYDLKLIM